MRLGQGAPVLVMVSLAAAVVAGPATGQTVDPIFANGFEPGLVAFGPAFTAVAEGSMGVNPTSTDPLRVTLDTSAGVDAFVPITSSDAARLAASGGGVTVPAGLDNALVMVDALAAGAAPVTLWATLGNTMGAGVRVERALNETDDPAEADYCNVQFPASFSVGPGQTTPLIYGRLFEAGVTQAAGPPAGWIAQIGYGLSGSDPRSLTGWRFSDAVYNLQIGNDDEFQASFTAPASAGSYAYTYRFSGDGGGSWTYCDTDGAGSNAGLTFEVINLGTMTVSP